MEPQSPPCDCLLAGLKLGILAHPHCCWDLMAMAPPSPDLLYHQVSWPNAAGLGPSQSLHQATEDVVHLGLWHVRMRRLEAAQMPWRAVRASGVPEGIHVWLSAWPPLGLVATEIQDLKWLLCPSWTRSPLIWTMTNKGLNSPGR